MKITRILQRRKPGEVRARDQCHIVVSVRTDVGPEPVCDPHRAAFSCLGADHSLLPFILQTPSYAPAVHQPRERSHVLCPMSGLSSKQL